MGLYEVSYEIRISDRFEDSGKAMVYCEDLNLVEDTLSKELELNSFEKLVIKKLERVSKRIAILMK